MHDDAALAYLELLRRALIGTTSLFSEIQLNDCPNGSLPRNPRNGGVLANAGYDRLINMQRLLDEVRIEHVKGDYVECGVWRGGISLFMSGYAKVYEQVDRKTWLFDSFEGVPVGNSIERWKDANGVPLDSGWEESGDLSVSLENVQRHFVQYDVDGPSNVFVQGWFSKTLPATDVQSIAVLIVDGDLYSSTYLVLQHLYHRVSIGGWVILDDWGVDQSRQAVEDFRKQHGITEEITLHDPPGCYPVARWRKARLNHPLPHDV